MTTLRIKSAVAFTNPALPVFMPQLNGFTKRSLVNLQRLAGAAPVTAAIDDVSGLTVACGTANTSPIAAALSGGGLHLKGNAWLPTAVAVDVTQPWTFAFGGQVLSTVTGSSHAGIIATPDYATRGVLVYADPPASPTAATHVVGILRQSIDGAQSGVLQTLTDSAGYTYDRGHVIFLQHLGSGAGTVEIWAGGALLYSKAITIDTTGVQGAVGSKSTAMKFSAGTPYSIFIGQDINCEGIALWNKSLTAAEKAVNYAAFLALATARGRAAAWA